MNGFECECGNYAQRRVLKNGYLGCDECISTSRTASDHAIIVKGENSVNKKMTHAEIQHIRTRKLGKDGLIHPHPRWDTREYD